MRLFIPMVPIWQGVIASQRKLQATPRTAVGNAGINPGANMIAVVRSPLRLSQVMRATPESKK
jgi:hypothetical protein